MANAKQLARLKQGTEVWNKWREENPRSIFDLSNAIFYQADLRGADLRRTNLSQATLVRSDLSGANLNSASLYQANLSGAYLGSASLNEANLKRASSDPFEGRVSLKLKQIDLCLKSIVLELF